MKTYLFIYSEFLEYAVKARNFYEAKLLEDKNPKKYFRKYGTQRIEYMQYMEVYRISGNERLRVI